MTTKSKHIYTYNLMYVFVFDHFNFSWILQELPRHNSIIIYNIFYSSVVIDIHRCIYVQTHTPSANDVVRCLQLLFEVKLNRILRWAIVCSALNISSLRYQCTYHLKDRSRHRGNTTPSNSFTWEGARIVSSKVFNSHCACFHTHPMQHLLLFFAECSGAMLQCGSRKDGRGFYLQDYLVEVVWFRVVRNRESLIACATQPAVRYCCEWTMPYEARPNHLNFLNVLLL